MKHVDYHTHTTFSDGTGTIREMLAKAAELGLDTIAITDHFDLNDPRPHISNITADALLNHFAEIKEAAHDFSTNVLCGIETTPLPGGKLDITDDVRKSCDLIITSCHYMKYDGIINPGEFFNDRYWEQFKEIVLETALAEGDIFGHVEEYLPIKEMIEGLNTTFAQRREICRSIADRYFDRPFFEKLTDNLKKSGKACELHCETSTPREHVIEYMSRNGIRFTPGSDAHTVNHLGKVDWAYAMAEKYGFTLHIINGR